MCKDQENMHKNFFKVYNKSQSPCEQDDGMGNQKLKNTSMKIKDR